MSHRLALAFALALTTAACSASTRYALLGSRAFPTTEGEITLTEADAGGYDVVVVVDSLPNLARLGPTYTHYALWLTEAGTETPEFAGVLRVNAETRRGRGAGHVDVASLEVRVTVEESETPERPSGVVLVQSVLGATE